MPMVSTPALLLLFPNLRLGPHREFPTISWQREEKTQAWFTDGSARHHPEWTAAAPEPSETAVKGNPPDAPGCSLCLGGEMTRHVIISSWVVSSDLARRSGRNMTRKLVTRKLKFGAEVVQTVLSEWGKTTWRYSCPMWLLIKRGPWQRRSLIIKWMGLPVLQIPVSLFPRHPSWSNGLISKVATMAG